MDRDLIETYVRLLAERQVKQAHLSGDRTSDWGSDDHIADLEVRCADAAYWRDKYPKGSERRSHYRNVYTHLRKELQSAKKKRQINEKQSEGVAQSDGVIAEGGLVGHLSHLYDNRELSFKEMKTILRQAATGRLQKVSEKMDGMNLVFSYDLGEDKVKVTRGSDIQGGGMDAAQLASKFAGRGSVEDAFNKAFKVLEGAIGALPASVKRKVFGPSANRWYSMEVVYTKNPNVINYDSDNIVFHGWPVFKRDSRGNVEMSEDEADGVETLTRYVDRMQSAVNETGWKVRGPAVVAMRDLSNGTVYSDAVSAIESAMSAAGVSDSDTVGDYLQALLEEDVSALNLPPEVATMVVDRILEAPDAPNLVAIKKKLDKSDQGKVSEFVRNSPALLKGYVRPIELAVNEFAVEVLKGLKSTLIDDSESEVVRLRGEVQAAIDSLSGRTDDAAMSVLRQQMEKLRSVENITSPMEGVVFIWKGNAYKFTGSFAAANIILGFFKYGNK